MISALICREASVAFEIYLVLNEHTFKTRHLIPITLPHKILKQHFSSFRHPPSPPPPPPSPIRLRVVPKILRARNSVNIIVIQIRGRNEEGMGRGFPFSPRPRLSWHAASPHVARCSSLDVHAIATLGKERDCSQSTSQ